MGREGSEEEREGSLHLPLTFVSSASHESPEKHDRAESPSEEEREDKKTRDEAREN